MTTLNATEARKKLYTVIQEVVESHEPTHITSKNGNVIMMSETDWEDIQETLYLVSIPGMRESLIKAKNSPEKTCKTTLPW